MTSFLLSTTALAQTSVHGTGRASLTYSDNAFGARSDPLPGQRGPFATVYSQLGAGVLLVHEAPTALYEAGYGLDYSYYFDHPPEFDPNGFNNAVNIRGAFELADTDRLTLAAGATSRTFALYVLDRTRQGAGGVEVPANDTVILNLDWFEAWAHDFSDSLTGTQSSGAGLIFPVQPATPQPWRYQVNAGYGLDLTLGQNAHGIFANGTFFSSVFEDAPADPLQQGADEDRVLLSLIYRYRRDWDALWNSTFSGGFSTEIQPATQKTKTGPVGAASLNFVDIRFQGSLGVAHDTTVNLLANQVFVRDEVNLAGSYSLSDVHPLRANAGVSAGINRVSQFESGAEERITTAQADASIGWYDDAISLILSYQHFRQFDAKSPTNLLGASQHNTLTLFAQGTFPSRIAPPVVVQPPLRVDAAPDPRLTSD